MTGIRVSIISVEVRSGCEVPSKAGLRMEVMSERDIMSIGSGVRAPEEPIVSVV